MDILRCFISVHSPCTVLAVAKGMSTWTHFSNNSFHRRKSKLSAPSYSRPNAWVNKIVNLAEPGVWLPSSQASLYWLSQHANNSLSDTKLYEWQHSQRSLELMSNDGTWQKVIMSVIFHYHLFLQHPAASAIPTVYPCATWNLSIHQ